MAVTKTGLVGVVAGLIIGAAIFIYVATTLLEGLKAGYCAGLIPAPSNATGSTPAQNASVNASATFNTSVDAMATVTLTVGSLMAIAAVAVVGFWIVKNVIGGGGN